jgi:hypothetical protein
MKLKKVKRKLVFGKNTIVQLNDDMLSNLRGGSSDGIVSGDNILTRILTTK